MDRDTPWNHIVSGWPTTYFWTMDCTGRWRSMYVFQACDTKHTIGSGLPCCSFQPAWNVLCFRGHTKPLQTRWQNITVMTTSSSSDPYGQTTCQSSANRCRGVSHCVLFGTLQNFVYYSKYEIQGAPLPFCFHSYCSNKILNTFLFFGFLFIYVFIYSAVNVGEDCPVFDGLFEFCQLSAGGSAGKSC